MWWLVIRKAETLSNEIPVLKLRKLQNKRVTCNLSKHLEVVIVGLYPGGSPCRNSRRPGPNPGLRGGLEIVFNQQ